MKTEEPKKPYSDLLEIVGKFPDDKEALVSIVFWGEKKYRIVKPEDRGSETSGSATSCGDGA